MTDPPVQQDGATVTIRGDALALLYRGLIALAARHRRDGVTSPPLLHELRTVLFRATTMSPTRHKDAGHTLGGPCCNGQDPSDLVTVAEAAELLRLSKRQVQRLAAHSGGLGGVRVGRIWMLAKAPVLALAEERRDRDRRQLPR